MENYKYINIVFQEKYKKLDNLCKDCFSSVDGVSEYIRQMENEQYGLQRYIVSWEDDYKTLKHVRWIRNKLAHEEDTFQYDICAQQDLDFVTNFYERIINRTDPLAQMRVLKENRKNTQTLKRTTSINKSTKQTKETQIAITHENDTSTKQTEPTPNSNKKSAFSKLIEKIKKIFS